MTLAHATEHALYVHEADGYLIKYAKLFYNGEYGTLTFASDHGLTTDCEAAGNGDSGVYPGGAVDTGEQRIEAKPRLNQAITRCDVHHNTLGYSGTMGNAPHVYGNNFYDNSTGITTDSFFAGGHPGYPQDSAVFENNRIYSNNFNSFVKGSDVVPRVRVPVGTGILIAGGNNNEVKGNRIWDNWRRGAMPDAVSDNTGYGTTSNRNKFHNNVMGSGPQRRQGAERRGLLVGPVPGQHRQLLVLQRQRHHRPGRAADALQLQEHELGRALLHARRGAGRLRRRARVRQPDPHRQRQGPRVRREAVHLVPVAAEAWPLELTRTPRRAAAEERGELRAHRARRLPPGAGHHAFLRRLLPPGEVSARRRAGGLLAAAALAAAGCGGGSGGSAPESGPVGLSASQLQVASCSDWKKLSLRERYSALDQLKTVASGPDHNGATLPQQKAYDTIDGRCKHYFARGFLLYEMYNRAASFNTLSGDG
jgi:Right handed beta helix region